MGNQCKETVGMGAVGYLCRLEVGHLERDGSPHMAPEHGPSQIAYAKWERAKKEAAMEKPAETPQETPEEAPAPSAQDEAVSPWRTDEERVAIAMVSLTKAFDELPKPVVSWVRGAQAQLALVELWEAVADGPMVVDRDVLAGLIPDYLKVN